MEDEGRTEKTAVDYVVGIVSLVFELVFPISRKIAVSQEYLWQPLNFEPENVKTKEQFTGLWTEIQAYLQQSAADETNKIVAFRER